jgi:hypothetical protein
MEICRATDAATTRNLLPALIHSLVGIALVSLFRSYFQGCPLQNNAKARLPPRRKAVLKGRLSDESLLPQSATLSATLGLSATLPGSG